jgi:rhodanese-related sulfurtransferase
MDKLVEFAGNHTLLVLALIISFFVVAFTELRRKASGLVNVDAIHAVKLINNDAIVIDLRSTNSYALGHIVNAINVPSDELESKIEGLSSSKNKPIVTVCDTGTASTKAVSALKAAGFESAFGVKGGMAGWKEAGLPVVGGKKVKAKIKKAKKRKSN